VKVMKTMPRWELHVLYEKVDIPWTLPVFHYHNIYEIYILESGERTLIINNTIFETNACHAALINPNEFHRSYGTTPFSGICFHFSEKYLDLYFTQEAKKKLLKCFSQSVVRLDEKSMSEVKYLSECIENGLGLDFVYIARVLEILNNHLKSSCENKLLSNEKLFPIMEYINENFMSIKSLEQISEANFISKTHLCRIFKSKMGITVSQYLNTVKIQYSCELLLSTAKDISEIAFICGYTSVNYYERIFKKFMNCTPFEFRRNKRYEIYGK